VCYFFFVIVYFLFFKFCRLQELNVRLEHIREASHDYDLDGRKHRVQLTTFAHKVEELTSSLKHHKQSERRILKRAEKEKNALKAGFAKQLHSMADDFKAERARLKASCVEAQSLQEHAEAQLEEVTRSLFILLMLMLLLYCRCGN
jgi:hypothetical protein